MKKYIEKDSKFMRLNNNITIERLNSLKNKKVYVDILEKKTIISYYLELISINNNIVTFKKDDTLIKINISNIKGIEELINYNNINFEKYIGQEIILTDMHNEKEIVKIEYIENDDLCLNFLYENNNKEISETHDYPWPKFFVKNITLTNY